MTLTIEVAETPNAALQLQARGKGGLGVLTNTSRPAGCRGDLLMGRLPIRYCRAETVVFENFLPSAFVPSLTMVLVFPSLEMLTFVVEVTVPSRFNVAV